MGKPMKFQQKIVTSLIGTRVRSYDPEKVIVNIDKKMGYLFTACYQ